MKERKKLAFNLGFSDKDLQLIKKTYRRVVENFYENTKNQSAIEDVIGLGNLITQVLYTPKDINATAVISVMEILKIKGKQYTQLMAHLDQIMPMLAKPTERSIKYETLLLALQKSELFVIGCTVAIRFFEKLEGNSSEMDWKNIIVQLGRNIPISPSLCIELMYEICKDNELHSKLAVKSGLIKYIFLSYISATLEDKFNLYKSIKLIKIIASADRTILRDRQKSMALIIYTYEDCIPLIEEICNKCYDRQYSDEIDRKIKYDQNTIDQPYLWSYVEQFSLNNISQPTYQHLVASVSSNISVAQQMKTFAILANYSKFKRVVVKEALQIIPKNQASLLNFIKLCINATEIDSASYNLINFSELQKMVENSLNPKVSQMFKYLKEIKNKEVKIGSLSESATKMFNMQKNADFLMERAARIPNNNQQLQDIAQILAEKDRSNEFESDTLRTVKQKALMSLKVAILLKKNIDLNPILKAIQLNDVKLLIKLLEIIELSLMMNPNLIEQINSTRIIEIVNWIQENYNGELIEWLIIGQLLGILQEDSAWKQRLGQLHHHSHWLLAISNASLQDIALVFNKLEEVKNNIEKYQNKIPLMMGFLGRVLPYESKLEMISRFKPLFDLMLQNIEQNNNYKTNTFMFSYFLNNWFQVGSPQNNLIFEQLMEPFLKNVLSNFRSIEQEYYLLQNALPYKIKAELIGQNLDFLIGLYGKLASYIYQQPNTHKNNLSYDRISTIATITPKKNSQIFQILKFIEENSQIVQSNELQRLINHLLGIKSIYWQLYPNFMNIMLKVLSILSKTENPSIKAGISDILSQMIIHNANNDDISFEERLKIYDQIMKCLEALKKKGIFIDLDKIRKAVMIIKDEDVQQVLLNLLNDYKITEQPKKKTEIELPKAKANESEVPVNQVTGIQTREGMKQIDLNQAQSATESEHRQDLQKQKSKENIEEQLKLLDDEESKMSFEGELTVIQALRMLKNIIDTKKGVEEFSKLRDCFLKNELATNEKDILGHLLVKFYLLHQNQLVIDLLMSPSKTNLSKEACYQIVSNHLQTFVLSKRWKFFGRQWLDLAMKRIQQGFMGEGSQVAEYNLLQTADVEYFLGKDYHSVVISVGKKIQKPQEVAYWMLLVGTSCRSQPIKQSYVKAKLPQKILELTNKFQDNVAIITNGSYALSSLVFMQSEVCIEISKQKNEISHLLKSYRNFWESKAAVQSGACFISNLAYSNDEVKELLRVAGCVEILLQIFENNLDSTPDHETFKQLIRSLGNLSLSSKCSAQMIDEHFCALAIRMVEKLSILVSPNDKKTKVLKILIDLIANLSSHKYKLEVFHKEKITQLIFILLQTSEANPQLLMVCIDTIDSLCQCPEIENYSVTEKKLPYILIDVLKTQSDEKIVVKSTRLLTNLTINPACIPYILEANLLSVLANIVMPHFYGNKLAFQQKKKMETYILKIITRIYMSKQPAQTLQKSGYFDCLIRTIETSDVIEDAYVDILYYFSTSIPHFLNKRAFIAVIRILLKKFQNKDMFVKSLKIVKNLSSYNFESGEEDHYIQSTNLMYEKVLGGDLKEDSLFLLGYHLLRSQKLREVVRRKEDKVVDTVKSYLNDPKHLDTARAILFLINNPSTTWANEEYHLSDDKCLEYLGTGISCKLYRIDGSSKKAIIQMDQNFNIKAYKYPDGEVKGKYCMAAKYLKDVQYEYNGSTDSWNQSIFTLEKSLFDTKKNNFKNCFSLLGSSKWGEFCFINVQFQNEDEKTKFYRALSKIINGLR